MNKPMGIERLREVVRPLQKALASHRVYGCMETLADVRAFMEYHVFAVWDFMSLLKSLQRVLTCVSVPWMPVGDPLSRRLINAIVLAEESDDDGEGGYISHFEMYLAAMQQCGADTSNIDRFVEGVSQGHGVINALATSGVPDAPRRFLETTWEIVESASPHRIAAAFSLGREEIIPEMFKCLVTELQRRFPDRLTRFERYLERHVDVDQAEHGPMAIQMLLNLCGDDPRKWREAEVVAVAALRARVGMWDAVALKLRGTTDKH